MNSTGNTDHSAHESGTDRLLERIHHLMETLQSSPFVLSWEPEIEDYRETFRARNRAKRVMVKVAVMGVALSLMTVFGLITQQAVLVACGVDAKSN